MPLSEHEQRQLEQIEQALYADYPRFANAVRASDPRVHYKRRVIQAGVGFLVGVGLLLTGVSIPLIFVGVAGFVVMLACSMWAVTSYRHMNGIATGRGPAAGRGPGAGRRPAGAGPAGRSRRRGRIRGRRAPRSARPKMMERIEERWRRRQERGGF